MHSPPLAIDPENKAEEEASLQAEEAERPPSLPGKDEKHKVFDPLSKHILALLIPASIFGALTRLGLTALATYEGNAIFPLAYTQAVGCLVMGFALGLKEAFKFYPPLYTAITTGFCGSVTTFSSWQLDVFNSWINSGSYHHGGLRNFIDGIGKTTFTLAISLASVIFGESLGHKCRPIFQDLPGPGRKTRYTISIASVLIYVAALLTYFLLSPSFRHQATATLLFAYPGALSRYLLSIALNTRSTFMPLGTFTANIVGTALLAGSAVAQNRVHPISTNACTILRGVQDGYCGCLTTVSTFAVELRGIRPRRASRYALLSWGTGQILMVLIFGSAIRTGFAEKEQTCLLPTATEAIHAVPGTGATNELMEEPEEQEDGYTSSTPTSTLTWITWFCSLPGHEYFCEVTEDFIEDDFNLTGLNTMVPFWKEAMEMVLDVEGDEENTKIPDVSIVESSAEMLYGLVHQRYILTRNGLQAMVEKYENGVFGSCPRVYCMGTNVVPCGRSDMPGIDIVKLFCPNCNDVYVPPSSKFQGVDGAFFGTTFAHLFFQTYRELAPAPFWKPPPPASSSPLVGPAGASRSSPFNNPNPHGGQRRACGYVYTPRIYGFKVSERSKSGPRMQWLRLRPESPHELDLVDWRGRWTDDEDDYDEEDGDEDGDRQMEDFDPDHGEDDEEEDEEEEEEEATLADAMDQDPRGHRRGGMPLHLGYQLSPPTTTNSARTSPTSSTAPRTPQEVASTTNPPQYSQYTPSSSSLSPMGGKLRVVRQWQPQVEAWTAAAQG